MDATRSFSSLPFGVSAGAWRWAAAGLMALAVAAGVLALVSPGAVGWAGFVLLAGIAAVAILLLVAVWPRQSITAADAKRVAEAASRANIAWAITGEGGAVVDCNPVY